MGIYFGADYYPEHWPKERWETDARMMREMGLDVVRMAEFAWSRLEPREGEFAFEWLDEVIEILAAQGIKCVLGTPTAAPPAWIIEANPEIEPMDAAGHRRHFGGRHHDCQSNPIYRAHIKRYVTAFARHYADNPNVIGFQIDNELGNSHEGLCFCPSCENAFRNWLTARYGSIETLNQKWGTAFWSQDYQNFDQVHAPRNTAAGQNPSRLLDWKRFCSDLIVDFHKFQADILRKYAPGKFITHNLMGFTPKVSYFDLEKDLDFVSHDQYPLFAAPNPREVSPDAPAAALDFIRGIKGETFWIMEQQSGITGWENMGVTPRPGQLAMWSLQSIAHGADTVVYFRWRSCAMGTEQYWHGLLPHSGIPGRCFEEIKAFIQKVKPLMGEIQGLTPRAKAAIFYSYDQEYAFEIQPQHPELRYIDQVQIYHRALFNRNIPVDFVHEENDLSGYDLVIAPLQYLMTPALEQKFRDYVEKGGHLALTMRTGVKDESNLCLCDQALPGALGKILGLHVEEYDCLHGMEACVSWDGQLYPAQKWCDIIALDGAEPLAAYASEFYAGRPAITRNRFGKGTAYYIGTEPSDALADRLIRQFMDDASLEALGSTPRGVEITRRSGNDLDYFFVINHTSSAQKVDLPEYWRDYFPDQPNPIPAYGYCVYTAPKKA